MPVENRLAFSHTFKDTARVLTEARAGIAWHAVGHAMAAYEIALSYAKQRIQFGKSLASFQIIQNKLAIMLANLTSMQQLCLRLAQLQAGGKLTDARASLAKMNNARLAREVVADAREMLGGNGILLENHIARHYADIEAVFTHEGRIRSRRLSLDARSREHGLYMKPFRLDQLASIARMGISALNHRFRAATSLSPLQYQKQLRLVGARKRMLVEGLDATRVALEVGYESTSQFTRGYKRLFGEPPMRDVKSRRLSSSSATHH